MTRRNETNFGRFAQRLEKVEVLLARNAVKRARIGGSGGGQARARSVRQIGLGSGGGGGGAAGADD